MSVEFETIFITTSDKPALMAVDNPEYRESARSALVQLGYKVHMIDLHEEFYTRFSEIPYQVIVIDANFGGTPDNNQSLQILQQMPMNVRRHGIAVLIGGSFETLNAMQAFAQSVHAVVNYSELNLLPQIVQKIVSDNDVFLQVYRDTVKRVIQGRSTGGI
jgi:hypothetical protein